MRPRAGTHPVTLQPSTVAEIVALARQHDERVKDMRQDIVRLETQLRGERMWKWPVRLGCVGLGVIGLAVFQNDAVRAGAASAAHDLFANMRTASVSTLITLGGVTLAIVGVVMLVRRLIEGPSPEKKARKLMEQFARTDGVAAYVFSPQETSEEETETVTALLEPKNKQMRQRRMTNAHRLLTTSLTRLLDQSAETDARLRQRQLN